jgi:N-acetylneuraminic acid mutarotase
VNHAAAVIGGIMLVMGGFSSETKQTLDDFNLFDFQTNTWLKLTLTF